MNLQKENVIFSSIRQLGFYKLLFSQKVAFCFVLLFISTAIVAFSGWAVYKHIIDSSTFGTVVVTFGGITATLAGVYNIVHAINDRASMQIDAASNAAAALANTNAATVAAVTNAATETTTVAVTNTTADNTMAVVAIPATTPSDAVDPTLPSKGVL